MIINLRLRNMFYLLTGVFLVWFLFTQMQVLTPFVLGMIFAYIFNPLINAFAKHLKVPRSISIILVYIILIGSAVFSGVLLTKSIIKESENIKMSLNTFLITVKNDVNNTPDWLQPYFNENVDYFANNQLFGSVFTFPVVSKAFFGIINFFVFLFSAFFFLKDSRKMVEKFLLFIPNEYRVDITILLKKINLVLASYLRGQIVLIMFMVIALFLSFSVLGVRNALTISLFSAVFEIVPFLGPLVAAIFGTFLIVITGGAANFNLELMQTVIVVLLIYYSFRLIQDYIVSPLIIGKATKLHPLIILFSVMAGEHIYGILGVLLAVPIAATVKIIYEFFFDIIYNKDIRKIH